MWGRAAQGGDRIGSQNLQRAKAGAARAPDRGRGRGGEAGGGAHPQGGQVDVVQAAGWGWVAHGRRGATHAPARSLRCRRRRFSPIGGPEGRAPPRLPRRPGRGRASGRIDPGADRRSHPRACNPSCRLPCARAERTVTRTRRADPPPVGRRHLRAGAGERAEGTHGPSRAKTRRGRSVPTRWCACAHTFSSFPLFIIVTSSLLVPSLIFI